jgi:hypothetical protein
MEAQTLISSHILPLLTLPDEVRRMAAEEGYKAANLLGSTIKQEFRDDEAPLPLRRAVL